MTRDELFMKKALELAEIAAEQGEVPVGAIVEIGRASCRERV